MHPRIPRVIRASTLLVLLVPLLTLDTLDETARAATGVSSVRVAVANVSEGGLAHFPADMRSASDRAAFARRLFDQRGRVPDVVLLQEVLGSASRMARALNQHPRAIRAGARYTVAVGTRWRTVRGSCDGPRAGRFSSLRGATILVNKKTVRAIHDRGNVRTWGYWAAPGRAAIGGTGHGCTEHPWVRLSVKQPGKHARTVRVASVHVAPVGERMKNRAAVKIRQRLDALHRRTPHDLLVMGGDFNLTRCAGPKLAPEKQRCVLNRGHRSIRKAGYVDAVQSKHLTGSDGVVGVGRRLDYLYTKGRVRASWFDRCYQAYYVHRYPCRPAQTVFPDERQFNRVQDRELYHGRAGGGVPSYLFKRYYSDHPIILATLR